MVADSVIVTSEVFGFISFGLTVVTWLGVYLNLITTAIHAPTTIPLVLGNLRAELQSERSLMRHRIKSGDEFHIFPGRQTRRIGKNDSYQRLLYQAIRLQWRSFCAIERKFKTGRAGQSDAEDAASQASDAQDSESEGRAEKPAIGRGRDARAMRRRDLHIKSRMGMWEAGLSVDRTTYYNTNLRHRIMWWWYRDELDQIEQRVQRLQIRRIEIDLYECNELVKRGLIVLGEREGVDVFTADNGSRTSTRRRGSKRSSKVRMPSRAGRAERDVIVREVRRTRTRSPRGPSSPERAVANTASRRSTVIRGRDYDAARRGTRSDVEYEIVRPGRIWVDVNDGDRVQSRRSTDLRRGSGIAASEWRDQSRRRQGSDSES